MPAEERRNDERSVETQPNLKASLSPVLRAVKGPDSQETVKSAEEEWLEAFEGDFWEEYPRRTCKFAARKAWMRIKPWTQETCDAIFTGLGRWVRYWRESETEKEFIPHPATWLNQHRWEDEAE